VDVRDVSIISQVAAKAATELLVANIKAGAFQDGDMSNEEAEFGRYYGMVRSRVLADVLEAEAQRQFEGSKSEPAPEPFVANTGPAPVPGAASTDIDLLWREYFRNPGDWWDNRQNKTNPNGPDFKKKVANRFASADEKRNAPALWIDRKDTPTWVLDQLGKF
jgi:hypothetical protein